MENKNYKDKFEGNNDLVFIKYKKQVAFYLLHNVKPVDITLDENETLVFVYEKSETRNLYNQFKKLNVHNV